MGEPNRRSESGAPRLHIGPYRVDSLLGKGGMGEVYRAWDERLERWVAVKRLLAGEDGERDEPTRERFRREARILAGLRHPAIVRVFELIERDDGDYLVMELVEGPNLAELLLDGPLALRLVADYGRQTAEGLAAAHAAGIVHRDLKTENVMLQASGQVRILDFGLAKQLRLIGSSSISFVGQVMGTPRAMSPEQACGQQVDERTDLFALGVLLYELLTSRSPFRAGSLYETLARVAVHDPPPVRQLVPETPEALSDLICRLLKKAPEERPASASVVAEEIAAITAWTSSVPATEASGNASASFGNLSTAATENLLDLAGSGCGTMVRVLLIGDWDDDARFAENLGDGERTEFFQRCDERLRPLIAEHGGRKIDRSGGFLALFARARAAVSFASAYHAISTETEESGALPPARIGIHLGEVIVFRNPPEDVARGAEPLEAEGAAKPVAERLMRLAGAGRTLLSRAAFEAARRSSIEDLPEMRRLRHGFYRLPGSAEPVEVFEIAAAGENVLTPPPGALKERDGGPSSGSRDAVPSSSPPERPRKLRRRQTPDWPAEPYPVLLPIVRPELLAGREREIAELRRLLRRPQPLILLSAPSGTGKSSLLLGGLVPILRREGRAVAATRYPEEPGLVRRLLADLFVGSSVFPADDDRRGFLDALEEAERLSGSAPLLVLDQCEEVLRTPSARARLGPLLAASVLGRPGIETPRCRWLLAVREEAQGGLAAWLSDVLAEARNAGEALDELPYDLSGTEHLRRTFLAPLATVRSGSGALEAASKVFLEAILKPLTLVDDAGNARYPWRFAPGHAERLARAFGESRLMRPEAPLGPELQVVLAHLLARSAKGPRSAISLIEAPEQPQDLIEQALEEHLRRGFAAAFADDEQSAGRARALLALRELATADGRRREGLPSETLIRAIGEGGEEVLERLSSPLLRLVVATETADGLRWMLSHDRLAEVVTRAAEEDGRRGGLLIDRELLAVRRVVTLQSALFAFGETQTSTRLSKRHFRKVAAHGDALLWDAPRRDWWAACRRRLRRDRLRRISWTTAAAMLAALVVFGVWTFGMRQAELRELRERVVQGEPSEAFEALAVLRDERMSEDDLSVLLYRRKTPSIVLEEGLDGLTGERRNRNVLATAAMLLPRVEENPEDFVATANLVWALDFAPGRDPLFAEEAQAMRDRVLAPLRALRPPPPLPAAGDPEWIEIPAGRLRSKVEISAFRMQRHEATNAEYRRLVPEHEGEDDLPARFVNWYAAATYAAWLGGRLPTESEWEYAAKAGCAFAYCDGEGREATVDEAAWTLSNSADPKSGELAPRPVMSRAPNPWGLYDMLGNVREWTSDWYDGSYLESARSDPWGPAGKPADGVGRVNRGGSFRGEAERTQPKSRGRNAPALVNEYQGVRVVIP